MINLILDILSPVLERLFPIPQFTPQLGCWIEINDNYEKWFDEL